MDKQIDDQDSLIQGKELESSKPQSNILIKYIVSKLFPFFWIFIASLFISSLSLIYFIAIIFVVIDFWFCRREYSYKLVGLTWTLDMPDPQLSFEDIVTYQIEPDPFVPSTNDSNVFWLLLIGTTVFYLLLTIYNLLKIRVGPFFCLLIISPIEVFNAYMYLKCLSVSKKQSEEKAKSLMINAVHSEFLDAVPVPEDIESPKDQETQNTTNTKEVEEKSTESQKEANSKDDDNKKEDSEKEKKKEKAKDPNDIEEEEEDNE